MARLDPSLFWAFLTSQDSAKQRLTPTEQRLLDLSLKYRLYAGKIAAHASLLPHDAPDCEAFAIVGRQSFCNPDNLLSALDGAAIEGEPAYGHVLGKGPRVLVYSKIGDRAWQQFHSVLRPLAEEGKIEYVHRHLVQRCQDNDKISGFGLEMEVKEYGEDFAYKGYNMTSPDQVPFEFIGTQAIQMVLDDKASPLETLSILTENAPLLAKHLGHVRPTGETRDKAAALAQHYHLPETLFIVNGADMQTSNVEMQTILEFLVDYAGLVRRHLSPLSSGDLASSLGRQIMHSMLQPHAVRFDVRTGGAIWMNDLEKDSRYRVWPRTLQALLRPPTGQFYAVARNLVVMTVIINIDNVPARLVEELVQMPQQLIPIQMAIVLTGDRTKVEKFYAVGTKYGPVPMMGLLHHYVKSDVRDVDELFELIVSEHSLADTPLDDLVLMTRASGLASQAGELVRRLSTDSSPAIYINGRHVPYDPLMFGRTAIGVYQEEIYNVQMSLLEKELDDESNYFELLMDDERTFKSRHSTVFQADAAFMDAVPYDASTKWSYSEKATDNCAFSVMLYLDADRKTDIEMAKIWLETINKTGRKMRLSFVPVRGDAEQVKPFWKLAQGLIDCKEALSELAAPTKERADAAEIRSYLASNRKAAVQLNETLSSGPVVTINGRIYGPFADAKADIEAWLQYEWSLRAERLQLLRMKSGLERNPSAMTLMTLYEGQLRGLLRQRPWLFTGQPGIAIPAEKVNHFVTKSNEAALLHVTTMLNPFSVNAAKIAAILLELGTDLVEATVILNALPAYSTSPLKGVYRFRGFDGKLDGLDGAKVAVTLNTPAAWDVDGAADNVDMDEMRPGQQADITLRNLLVEGEVKLGAAGRGLPGIPVELADPRDGRVLDKTTSISPHGYAQLRATPGVYTMRVPPVKDLEALSAIVHLDSIALNRASIAVAMPPEYLQDRSRFVKALLDSTPAEDTINIFSIASGATYERLVRIMMASVMRGTKSPVKFWLISTYLTPGFRSSLRRLSQKYNFAYELLPVRWPAWMLPQWRKHRRVWAHKILFLDLFPMHIRRLIYIDADQVVRGDVAELAALDMEGRVYGFVPFCEDRPGTAKLRFWKSGYWAEHLQGRRYHISALFVVDMAPFRMQGVADRLRTQYQSLSHDPNSLANLDQDLPNNLQHEVPIYALPAEWLWCETWCAEESKGRAKSIDLCSNPLRKEDKLAQGRRIITEWATYDAAIQDLLSKEDALRDPLSKEDALCDDRLIQKQTDERDEL